MLQPLRDKGGRGNVVQSRGITAPWRGLNLRDRLEEQSTEYAIQMDNFIPENGEATLRNGYSEHVTGLPATIETLMEYATGSATKLFAASSAGIYDVTTAGAVGSAAVSGLSNSRWSHTQFGTTSGQYLVCTNGADGVRNYNGSTWATPTITGATSADLNYVTSHKGRLWFIEKDSLSLWYLATNAISGAATEFPLEGLVRNGGTLVAASSWSIDSGDGQDDLFVIVTSEGEVLVYAGTDPASNYSLKGIFKTARPLGNRCMVRYGGELVILTRSGPVACSELLRAVAIQDQQFAALVRSGFIEEAVANGSEFGWQAHLYTSRGWLMFNVPTDFGSETYRQYLLNEGSWFRFREIPAVCWGELSGTLYFGAADGTVYKADDPDAEGDNGTEIQGRLQWAWSRFGTPAKKAFKMARPHMEADAKPSPYMQMMTDYFTSPPDNQPTITSNTAGSAWDEGVWDVSSWAGSKNSYSQLIGLNGIGHVGSLHMRIRTKTLELFKVNGVEVMYETGGFR